MPKTKIKSNEEVVEMEQGTFAAAPELRHIYIFDIINSQMSASVIATLHMFVAQSQDEPIFVFVNSNGGSLVDGFAIYDALKDVPCPIITIATGYVASAAFLIYLAGDQRMGYPHVTFMAHGDRGGLSGARVKTTKNYLADITKQESSMFDVIAKETGKTKKYWIDLIDEEDYSFDLKLAKKHGVIKD